jgi:hypothetical protein
MAWFAPNLLEVSIIDQIETAVHDEGLTENEREDLAETLWIRLQSAHGGKVINIVSREGETIEPPFTFKD